MLTSVCVRISYVFHFRFLDFPFPFLTSVKSCEQIHVYNPVNRFMCIVSSETAIMSRIYFVVQNLFERLTRALWADAVMHRRIRVDTTTVPVFTGTYQGDWQAAQNTYYVLLQIFKRLDFACWALVLWVHWTSCVGYSTPFVSLRNFGLLVADYW